MNVQYLIQLLNNKISTLNNAKAQAYLSGDLNAINSIDKEILDTQNTLSQLLLVQQITDAAAATNTTTAQVVASGVVGVQTAPVVPDNPTAVLSSYDMSTYAADPLYLQKLGDILTIMPAMDTTQQIDDYIASEAIGSPLSGAMILLAAQQYNIDTRLLTAILELESNFGTAGVAVSTLNPGNVGNTGSTTRTYNSWQDGVNAVAQWLSLHPAVTLTFTTPVTLTPTIADSASTTAPIISSVATSTPPITVIPPYIDQATSTPPLDLSVAATSTPIVDPSIASSTNATSTNSASTSATSTPDSTIVGTSTPPVDLGIASSTNATSTGATSNNATSTAATSTSPVSTAPIDPLNLSSASYINPVPPTASSTPTAASSTQARRITVGKRRRV